MWLFLIFQLFVRVEVVEAVDLHHFLSTKPSAQDILPTGIQPLSYDLQLQLPLSETSDPDIPLFTGRCVFQFELHSQIGPETVFVSDSSENRPKLKFDIIMLDHFENVSLVFDGNELNIFNVLLTDDSMEISIDQPVLFPGQYSLTIHRYKGLIGAAIYYRDAGDHAVFGSNLFPNRAPAIFPTINSATSKATFSVSIVHPIGTRAISSAVLDGFPQNIDTNWQISRFSTTPAIIPSMMCLVLLPNEYSKIESFHTGINVTLHYNKYRIQESQAKHLLNLSTQILSLLKITFASVFPVLKLDLVIIQDVTAASCFGEVIISEKQFFSSDYASQAYWLSVWITKQWIGGLIAISEGSKMCLQEDIVRYVAEKIARKITNDEYLQVGNLAKILLTETIFMPGETLHLNEYPNELEISEKCGLKGVSMLSSIERLIGEKMLISKIEELMNGSSNNGSYSSSHFYGLLNQKVDGDIYISQLLQYWREHGGIPSMNIDRLGKSLKITQDQSESTVKNGLEAWEKMPPWPLPLEFTEFKLPVQIMISHGIYLSPLREGHVFSNLGFRHFYRVNYDVDTWRDIKMTLTENATLYTYKEKFQLLSDFCHFYSKKMLPEPAATILRNEFVQLVRLRPTSFPICDASIFQCVVPQHTNPKRIDKTSMELLRQRIFNSFTNSSEMGCRSGEAHDALNDMCTKLYGVACL